MTLEGSPAASKEQDALLQAAQAVLLPLARLMVARGVPFAALEEQLKIACIAAARDAALTLTPQALPHRLVSRISTATGINRREVTRLVQCEVTPVPTHIPPALRVFARWLSDPLYRNADGEPRVLPRAGGAPSFETLAGSVTKDVHARSLLNDMIRLKVATLDPETNLVTLSRETFVPNQDLARNLGFLGGNVGDHLSAAVANVLHPQAPPHFEQAVQATGLSARSLDDVRALVAGQWKLLVSELVPALQQRIDADEQSGREAQGRVSIGLFSYTATLPVSTPGSADAAPEPTKDQDHE